MSEQAGDAAEQLAQGADTMLAAAALAQQPPSHQEAPAEHEAAAADGSGQSAEQTPTTGLNELASASAAGLAQMGRKESTGTRQCRNCGGLGHFAKTCPLGPAQYPLSQEDDGARMEPPDLSKVATVFHARDGLKGQPPPREIPYSGSEKGRYGKLQEIGVAAGEWMPEEDAALMAIVAAEGPGDWTTKSVTLGAACGFRSSTAVRKRYNRLAGIEGPVRSTGESQGAKRKAPPEFDQTWATSSFDSFSPNGVCKGCIPRSKAKHSCGKQYPQATAARRYGSDYAKREYGNDGKIIQIDSRGNPGIDFKGDSTNHPSLQWSQSPSCAACEREGKRCAHKVDLMMPGASSGLPLPPSTKRSAQSETSALKGECDFCRRRDGGETLRTGCGCRDSFYGFAGHAHVTCLMKAAEEDEEIMHDCPKCEQRWKGELAIELARYNRSRSVEGPKGDRRPEDPECVIATVDLVATLCIAAIENQDAE